VSLFKIVLLVGDDDGAMIRTVSSVAFVPVATSGGEYLMGPDKECEAPSACVMVSLPRPSTPSSSSSDPIHEVPPSQSYVVLDAGVIDAGVDVASAAGVDVAESVGANAVGADDNSVTIFDAIDDADGAFKQAPLLLTSLSAP